MRNSYDNIKRKKDEQRKRNCKERTLQDIRYRNAKLPSEHNNALKKTAT